MNSLGKPGIVKDLPEEIWILDNYQRGLVIDVGQQRLSTGIQRNFTFVTDDLNSRSLVIRPYDLTILGV